MAWLAKLDARALMWSPVSRWTYRLLKWSLIALGAYLWLTLWFERDWRLGLLQIGLLAYVLWREVIASPVRGDSP